MERWSRLSPTALKMTTPLCASSWSVPARTGSRMTSGSPTPVAWPPRSRSTCYTPGAMRTNSTGMAACAPSSPTTGATVAAECHRVVTLPQPSGLCGQSSPALRLIETSCLGPSSPFWWSGFAPWFRRLLLQCHPPIPSSASPSHADHILPSRVLGLGDPVSFTPFHSILVLALSWYDDASLPAPPPSLVGPPCQPQPCHGHHPAGRPP